MKFWSSVFPNWLVAIGTLGAVLIALWQSAKGSRDDLQAKRDALAPRVYPETIRPDFSESITVEEIGHLVLGVVNFGTGPALNIVAEFWIDNTVFKTNMVPYDSPYVPFVRKSNVHLAPGESIHLATACRVEVPASFRVKMRYDSVFGEHIESDWFSFSVSKDRSVASTIQIEFELS